MPRPDKRRIPPFSHFHSLSLSPTHTFSFKFPYIFIKRFHYRISSIPKVLSWQLTGTLTALLQSAPEKHSRNTLDNLCLCWQTSSSTLTRSNWKTSKHIRPHCRWRRCWVEVCHMQAALIGKLMLCLNKGGEQAHWNLINPRIVCWVKCHKEEKNPSEFSKA